MNRPLPPEICSRLTHYNAELKNRSGLRIGHYGNQYKALRRILHQPGACDGKTIESGMHGANLSPDSCNAIAEFLVWLEGTYPWLLQSYAERGPTHLYLQLEAVQSSNNPDTRFSIAHLLYAQSYFPITARLLAGTAPREMDRESRASQ